MAHKATLTKRLGVRPFHIECSCNGTGGDFFDEASARQYMGIHAHRVKESSGEIVEIVDRMAEVAKPVGAQAVVPKPAPKFNFPVKPTDSKFNFPPKPVSK